MFIKKTVSRWAFIVATALPVLFMAHTSGFAEKNQAPPWYAIIEIDPQQVRPVDINATIMEITAGDPPTMVVGEETILITAYQERGQSQVLKTQLLGPDGEVIHLDDFEIDQRVIVTGLKQSDDTIVGERIQIDPEED